MTKPVTNFATTFRKYAVSLDTDMEGASPGEARVTGCWISFKSGKREYTASLECALNTAELTDNEGYVHDMEPAIVNDIEAWAVENGY